MLSRRAFATCMVAAPFLAAAGRKPNIILLFADDLGYGDVSFNGRTEWKTPNLAKLAREGSVFSRWYTAYPLCVPSRSALLSGRYGVHTGSRSNQKDLPASQTTIAEALRPLGYKSAQIGKWHASPFVLDKLTHPLDQGFDYSFGYLGGRDLWEHYPKKLYRGRVEEPNTRYSSDFVADEAIAWMRQNAQAPFFLYASFMAPHFKIEAPREAVERYVGNFPEKDPSRPLNATYAAMIDRMDAAIGRILTELERLGQANNTLVFFTSDNGATFEIGSEDTARFHDSNRPFRGQKRSLEEGGIRMPAVARWPGHIPAGVRNGAPMMHIDLLPTMLAAAGAPNPAKGVDGVNMLPVIRGKQAAPERTLFWEFQAENIKQFAAMKGDHKLLVIGDQKFLYNVRTDPQERTTLAPTETDLVTRLSKDLDNWLSGSTGGATD
jgi:arylsulfatase A-like enzyme